MADISTNPIAMDSDATKETKNYIIQLNNRLQQAELELQQADFAESSAEENANLMQGQLNKISAIYQSADTMYTDAQTAMDSLVDLRNFFLSRIREAALSKGYSETASRNIYGTTLNLGLFAQEIEYSLNLAVGYNENDGNKDPKNIAYSETSFINILTEVKDAAVGALTSSINATEQSFSVMGEVEEIYTMANYLYRGFYQAQSMITQIFEETQEQRSKALQEYSLAKKSNDRAQQALAIAKDNLESKQLSVTLYKAELSAAQEGAAGLSAKDAKGSG